MAVVYVKKKVTGPNLNKKKINRTSKTVNVYK